MGDLDIERITRDVLLEVGIVVDTSQRRSNIFLMDILKRYQIVYREKKLPEGMDGAFYRGDGANPHWIFVNSDHPKVRRRFTLAHEIGHYLLGHQSNLSIVRTSERWQEVQANKFASSILMPAEPLFKIHCISSTIAEIAGWFRVSEISMAIRLLDLGLRIEEAEIVKSDYYLMRGDDNYE